MIPTLHIVTDDEILARPDFERRAREVCENLATRQKADGEVRVGSVALHLRGPRTTGQELMRLAWALRQVATATGITLLLNDRLDVALAVGAGGVHLGARSVPPAEARRLWGPGRLLGVSVHSAAEGATAAKAGVDYLFVGTLFETPSHPGVAQGAEFMGLLASRLELPLIGIGGVTPERAASVLASGGHGVAAIRGIWDAPSPPDAVDAYLDVVDRGAADARARSVADGGAAE